MLRKKIVSEYTTADSRCVKSKQIENRPRHVISKITFLSELHCTYHQVVFAELC